MKIKIITDPTTEETSGFSDLKIPKSNGLFIAEGERIVPYLLASDIEITSLYLTEDHFKNKRPLIEAHEQSIEARILLASKTEMEKVVGFPLHQGIMAAGTIPKEKTLDELITNSPKPQLFIILDTIADAENIGALYRTALGMGATAIIVDNKSINPWIRRSVRVSMGAVFRLPTVTVTDLLATIEYLMTHGVSILAAEITDSSIPIWDYDFEGDVAIVFGSEGFGLRRAVLDACSQRVQIPMTDAVNSLNISVAQGMVLYEISRQRHRH